MRILVAAAALATLDGTPTCRRENADVGATAPHDVDPAKCKARAWKRALLPHMPDVYKAGVKAHPGGLVCIGCGATTASTWRGPGGR